MTRRDYTAMAAVFRDYHGTIPLGLFKDLLNDLILVFEEDNPNFDRGRFVAAIFD